MTRYLLDSNVFIQAKNLHYGFDFVPAFWDWLLKANHEGKVASIEQVADELRAGGDELSQWAEEQGDTFFLPADSAVLPALDSVSHRASAQNYDRAAIATFLQLAISCYRSSIGFIMHVSELHISSLEILDNTVALARTRLSSRILRDCYLTYGREKVPNSEKSPLNPNNRHSRATEVHATS